MYCLAGACEVQGVGFFLLGGGGYVRMADDPLNALTDTTKSALNVLVTYVVLC
jgi:hypothetical protein